VPRKHGDSEALACRIAAVAPKVSTFRVEQDFLDRLDAYAARTRRSRNGAINYLLEIALNLEELGSIHPKGQRHDYPDYPTVPAP
jgi:hypothetical protein